MARKATSGGGSVEKYGKRWAHRLYLGKDDAGRKQYELLGVYDTKGDAERARDRRLVVEQRKDRQGTVMEWVPKYLDYYRRMLRDTTDATAHASDKVRREYSSERARLKAMERAEFYLMPPGQVTEAMVQSWVKLLCTTPIEEGRLKGQIPQWGTVKKWIQTCRAFFDWVRDQEGVSLVANPARGVTVKTAVPRRRERPRHRPEEKFSAIETGVIESLIENRAMGLTRRAFFLSLAFSGIRPGHLKLIEWPDLDLATGRVTVRHNRKTDDGKARPYETVIIGPALQALRELHMEKGRPERGYVFTSERRGEPFGLDSDLGWKARCGPVDGKAAKQALALEKRGLTQRAIAEKLGVSRSRVQQLLGKTAMVGWGQKLGTSEPLYSLKHTFVTRMNEGDPLWVGGAKLTSKELSLMTGHEHESTTESYNRSEAEAAVAAGLRINRALGVSRS